jgi:signal transduction histidine kinase
VIARLVASYLAVFAIVLAALSLGAYIFIGQQYHSLLLPALTTPEGIAGYNHTMQRVLATIVAFDLPLLILVGIASWFLAKLSIAPLEAAQMRERQFVADAAHELRSPLATIASVAQSSGDLSIISRTALDASETIADLLTLARSPNGTMLQREPTDLAMVARTCIEELRPRAEAASIALDVQLESAIINGDARRLRELIRNLLENALRYARTKIAIHCGPRNGGATLSISDDGKGVRPEDRNRIFERFFRADDATEGTGLGLSIAQWVAHAHDGSIVVNDANPGAAFVVTLH